MWLSKIVKNVNAVASVDTVVEAPFVFDDKIMMKASSILMNDLVIEGSLISDGTLDIASRVVGNVEARCVTVREGSNIIGDIFADCVLVKGSIEGKIRCNSLIVASTGVIAGSIDICGLVVDYGARISAGVNYHAEKIYMVKVVE